MPARPTSKPQGKPITIAGHVVQPGKREFFDLELVRLPTDTGLSVPVSVINGARPGPTIWLNAAIHGDEINGVEIIRRLARQVPPKDLRGALVAVPIVNVFGFINQSRYLPDRRDLNRSFPGSARGSLAGQIAHWFLTEIVAHCDYGIDMHTGANHRNNLPQIRADLSDRDTRRLAEAFAPPIMLHSATRDGSLREAAQDLGKKVLLYEGGEPSRFNQQTIEIGVGGVFRVMHAIGMLPDDVARNTPTYKTHYAEKTQWVRAKRSGLLRVYADVGDIVQEGEDIGVISDAFDRSRHVLHAPVGGVIVGMTKLPLLNQGDAVANVAELTDMPPPRMNAGPRHTIFLEQ